MKESRGHRVQGAYGAKGTWILTLQPDWMILEPEREAGASIKVSREDIPDRVLLKDPAIGGPYLQVKAPRAVGFRISKRVSKAYAAWRGPTTKGELRAALKGLTYCAIPVGALWLFASLPVPADVDAGVSAVPADVLGLALGAGLVTLGILRLFVMTRWLFIVDAVWWTVFAGYMIAGILSGDSPWWGIMTVFAVVFVVAQIQAFRRFPPDRELVSGVAAPPVMSEP